MSRWRALWRASAQYTSVHLSLLRETINDFVTDFIRTFETPAPLARILPAEHMQSPHRPPLSNGADNNHDIVRYSSVMIQEDGQENMELSIIHLEDTINAITLDRANASENGGVGSSASASHILSSMSIDGEVDPRIEHSARRRVEGPALASNRVNPLGDGTNGFAQEDTPSTGGLSANGMLRLRRPELRDLLEHLARVLVSSLPEERAQADDELISQFTVFAVPVGTILGGERDCPICLEPLGGTIMMLPCWCVGHLDCITSALRADVRCPVHRIDARTFVDRR